MIIVQVDRRPSLYGPYSMAPIIVLLKAFKAPCREMSFDEHRDAVKICVIQDECQQMTNGPICDDEEDCFEASGQNEIETTTMFTSIKQLTEITRNEC